jgi:hypothetical protein
MKLQLASVLGRFCCAQSDCARVTLLLLVDSSLHCRLCCVAGVLFVFFWLKGAGFGVLLRASGLKLTHSRHCMIAPLPVWRHFVPADLQAVLGCSTCQFVLSVCLPSRPRRGCCVRTILWQRQCASRASGFWFALFTLHLCIFVFCYGQVGPASRFVRLCRVVAGGVAASVRIALQPVLASTTHHPLPVWFGLCKPFRQGSCGLRI